MNASNISDDFLQKQHTLIQEQQNTINILEKETALLKELNHGLEKENLILRKQYEELKTMFHRFLKDLET